MSQRNFQVLKPAVVGVIQTSSERDHNSEAGSEPFTDASQPWIEYEFYDENSVVDFYEGIGAQRFSAICFGSNSLFNPAIYDASCASAGCLSEAAEDGMGLVILQQFLPEGSERDCGFLPGSHGLRYRGIGYRHIEELRLQESRILGSQTELSLGRSTFGSREPVLWSTVEATHPRAWCTLATAATKDGDHDALMRTRAASGRVIASALPLDWIADHRLLAYAIGLAVRSTGTLYVHSEDERHTPSTSVQLLLGRSLARGCHLSSVAVASPGELSSRGSPFADFGHLVVSDEWGWPQLTGLRHERIRARLENGGSVSAYGSAADAAGERVMSVLRGRPVYLDLAHRFAGWYEANWVHFTDAPSTQVRALAVAVRSIDDSTIDEDEIPLPITVGAVAESLRAYFAKRTGGTDNVDGHVLPTSSVASAMTLLGFPRGEIRPLIRWIEADDFTSSFASVQQAALWLPEISVQLDEHSSSDLERIYEWLLEVRDDSTHEVALARLLAILSDPNEQVSRKAIVAEALAGFGNEHILARAAGAARQLQNDLDLAMAAQHAPLEVVCLLTAFLVRVHASQGPIAGVSRQEALPPQTFDPNVAHHRRELEEAHQKNDRLEGELRASREFGARSVSWAIAAAIFLTAAGACFVASRVRADWTAWVSVLVPVVAIAGAILAYVGHRSEKVGCEPRSLAALRDIFQR